MVKKTLLDIIIPVYNRFDILEECLEAIPDACGNIEYNIFFFDNGSEKLDANKFYSKLNDEHIFVFRSQENLGFPKACNQAFRKGRSPLVLFLNSDVVLEKGSIKKMVMTLDDPTIGVCGMKLLFPSEEKIQQAGIDIKSRPADRIQHVGLVSSVRAQIYHVFLGWDADHPKANAITDIMAVTGASLMTRRQLFSSAGKFWEGYGKGTYEDVDFCLTIQEMGFRVVVNTDAVGIHYTGATVEKYQAYFPLQENYQKFLLRWKSNMRQTDIDVL